MKVAKPNWSSKELNANYLRWTDLIHETDSHLPECDCNLCMECFGLGGLLGKFTEDEHAQAILDEYYPKSILETADRDLMMGL